MVYNYTTSVLPEVSPLPVRGGRSICLSDARYLYESAKQIRELFDGYQGDAVEVSRPIRRSWNNDFRSELMRGEEVGVYGCACSPGSSIPFGDIPLISPGTLESAADTDKDEAILAVATRYMGSSVLYGPTTIGSYRVADNAVLIPELSPIKEYDVRAAYGVLSRRAVVATLTGNLGGDVHQEATYPQSSSYWYFTDTEDGTDLIGTLDAGSYVDVWSVFDYDLQQRPMQAVVIGMIRGSLVQSGSTEVVFFELVLAVPMTIVTQTLEMQQWYTRRFASAGGLSASLIRSQVVAALGKMGYRNLKRVQLSPYLHRSWIVIDAHKMPYNEIF